MAWNEFSGCGRPMRIDFEALLAKTATDADLHEAVSEALSAAMRYSDTVDIEALTTAAITAVLQELAKEPFG